MSLPYEEGDDIDSDASTVVVPRTPPNSIPEAWADDVTVDYDLDDDGEIIFRCTRCLERIATGSQLCGKTDCYNKPLADEYDGWSDCVFEDDSEEI